MPSPMKPIDYLILVALFERDRHGYGIKQDVEALSGGETRLDAGNLYRSLRRLVAAGWVQAAGRRAAGESQDERRRYYRLTVEGRRAVAAETERMKTLLASEKVRRLASLST